jgi:hypothetical protein
MSTDEEFRRIQEQTEQASARLNALRKDLHVKLDKFSVNEKQHLRDKIRLPLSPMLNGSSRLANIAASLSPSNASSPGSRRAAVGGNENFTPASSSSLPVVRGPQHFPINTPPAHVGSSTPTMAGAIISMSSKSSPIANLPFTDVLTEYISSQLDVELERFSKSVDELLSKIAQNRIEREEYFENFLHQISDQERTVMGEVVEAIRVIGEDTGEDIREELIEDGMAILKREMAVQKRGVEQMKKALMSEKIIEIEKSLFSKVEKEFETIRTRLTEIRASVNCDHIKADICKRMEGFVEKEVEVLKMYMESELTGLKRSMNGLGQSVSFTTPIGQTSHASSTVTKLTLENSELRKLIRKMKLSLSKWRIDYLKHAQAVRETAVTSRSKKGMSDVLEDETAAPTPIPKRQSPVMEFSGISVSDGVTAGNSFGQLSESLMRTWSAVPPSAEELVQFLVNMEASVGSRGKIPISSVYDYECKKNTHKLPIAQLAAQREFLLSKDSSQDYSELIDIENELLRMISEYEKMYNQKFVFNTNDEDGYAHSIRNHRYERSIRDQ